MKRRSTEELEAARLLAWTIERADYIARGELHPYDADVPPPEVRRAIEERRRRRTWWPW